MVRIIAIIIAMMRGRGLIDFNLVTSQFIFIYFAEHAAGFMVYFCR